MALFPFILGKFNDKICTVNSTAKVMKLININSILFIAIAVLSIITTGLYLIKYIFPMSISILFHVIWGASTYFYSRFTFQASKEFNEAVLAFHDFLINYKSTPRSRMLRKHLPKMDAVVEVASQFEQSQISMSKTSLMSPSSQSLN